MDYEKKSDKQINLEVAKYFYDNGWLGRHEHLHDSSFDYCNNPSDAWPIIESIWDELMRTPGGYHGNTVWNQYCEIYKSEKLRAAMICFLKIKDFES